MVLTSRVFVRMHKQLGKSRSLFLMEVDREGLIGRLRPLWPFKNHRENFGINAHSEIEKEGNSRVMKSPREIKRTLPRQEIYPASGPRVRSLSGD